MRPRARRHAWPYGAARVPLRLEVFDPSGSRYLATAAQSFARDGDALVFRLPVDVAGALGMSLELRAA